MTTMPEPQTVRIGGHDVEVLTAATVVVGTGSAGYCAAERLVGFGHHDVLTIADKIRAGSSRNAGSDKQTYYKLTLSGDEPDSVGEMALTLFAGGAMDGDNALVEAALSARGFLHLCDLGVPFPQNRYGEFIGYKTDHDPRRRATSVGPFTSRTMVEQLEKQVQHNGTPVLGDCRVVDVVTEPGADGQPQVAGLLVLRTDVHPDANTSPFLLLRCTTIVYATGGPAGMYATRVFPNGQWGASGAAYRAGVHGKNLTEWQFGLASIKPRWNVSGTYMQVLPRFVSTDADGGDEQEFLTEAITDYGRLLSLVFLKGYQWPFDIRKVRDGSSLIDVLVYQETVLRGRRVFLDFKRNPGRDDLEPSALSPEAREYLDRAGVLFGTPVERLRAMNEPAYQFYLEKNPGIDLETDLLEVVDSWWQSNLAGFFPVGEAAGSHGVYRPGGAALNSGQVGATRAAQFIAARRSAGPDGSAGGLEAFVAAAAPVFDAAVALVDGATRRASAGAPDNTCDLLRGVQELMSRLAGPVRSAASIREALDQVHAWLGSYESLVVADGSSRRSINRTFLVRDTLTSAWVYLSAMADYVEHGGRSRGSVLYTDPSGQLPAAGFGEDPELDLDLPELFRFSLDGGALDAEVQECAWIAPGDPGELLGGGWEAVDGRTAGDPAGTPVFRWRPRRPIPENDDFFENVWREFREHRNIC